MSPKGTAANERRTCLQPVPVAASVRKACFGNHHHSGPQSRRVGESCRDRQQPGSSTGRNFFIGQPICAGTGRRFPGSAAAASGCTVTSDRSVVIECRLDKNRFCEHVLRGSFRAECGGEFRWCNAKRGNCVTSGHNVTVRNDPGSTRYCSTGWTSGIWKWQWSRDRCRRRTGCVWLRFEWRHGNWSGTRVFAAG